MKIYTLPARNLSDDLASRWTVIQRENPQFASPYLSPEYAKCVGAVRSDAYVAVLEEGNTIAGFFAYQRSRGGVGQPAGGSFSSYQAVVVSPDADWSAEALMKGCRLSILDLPHALASQTPLLPYEILRTESPVMDLEGGYAAYEQRRFALGGTQLKRTYRMMRKLQRECTGYRYVRHVADPAVLRQLMAWKSEQCGRRSSEDIFRYAWSGELLAQVHATQREDFGGVLSAIYVEDRAIALELCLRAPTNWHRWICAYDPAFGAYSPGVILGVEIAKAAALEGVQHLDMGKGRTFYKDNFMTTAVPLAEVTIALPSLARALRAGRRRMVEWARQSWLSPLLRMPGRWLARQARKRRYR